MADVGFLEANLFPDGGDVFEAGRLEEESDMGLGDFGDQANDCGGIIGDRAVVSFQQDFGVLDFGGEMFETLGYDLECGGIGGGDFGAREETDFFESVEGDAGGEVVNSAVQGGIGSNIRIDVEVGTEDGWGEARGGEEIANFGRGGGVAEVRFEDFDFTKACGGDGGQEGGERLRDAPGSPAGGFESDRVQEDFHARRKAGFCVKNNPGSIFPDCKFRRVPIDGRGDPQGRVSFVFWRWLARLRAVG